MKGFLFIGIVAVAIGFLSMANLRLEYGDSELKETQQAIIKFYDMFGPILMNNFYHHTFEEIGMDLMLDYCNIRPDQVIVELGPGTGFLAGKLLRRYAEHNVSYIGADLSSSMLKQAKVNLHPFIENKSAQLYHVPNSIDFLESLSLDVDRIIFTYVLDLMSEKDLSRITTVLYKKLKRTPGSKVCIVNLTYGFTALSRVITNLWQLLYVNLGRALVGGCRPISVLSYFYASDGFKIDYIHRVTSAGLPSEVAIISSSL